MKKFLILAFFIFLITGCSKEGTITKITCDNMKELIKDDAILVDVRSASEYEEGHLKNAINKPLTKLSSLDELDKETKLIVYCKSGVRSNNAAQELLKMGFKNIYDLGSMSNCNV